MRTTRSASRAQASTIASERKRKIGDEEPKTPTKKRSRATKTATTKETKSIPPVSQLAPSTSNQILENDTAPKAQPMVPALLTFSFEEGKKHLISVDHRFQDLFGKMPCKPFEHLEMVHPFRGQQISWFAARSVNHKFVRLFEPSIPEKIEDYALAPLPSRSIFPD
ncbi:hypothetical protein C0989_005905 [Termitomyces sp. Mn162]|nr:hypothetical protein C0989_005905 [Termitomyces sp. Mn162]